MIFSIYKNLNSISAGLQKGLLGGRLFPEYEIVMAGDDSPEIPEDDNDSNDDQEGDDRSCHLLNFFLFPFFVKTH